MDIVYTPNPDVIQTSNMGRLMTALNTEYNTDLKTAADIHTFSITQAEKFWAFLVDHLNIRFYHKGDRVITDPDTMIGGQFFTDSTLNFAENLLQQTGKTDCLVFRSEQNATYRLSWDLVHVQVAKIQQYLSDIGVQSGDIVAGFVPNCPQSVIAMLATTALGAVWTSCSPDFGVDGVVDRFGSTQPKVLFSASGYYYNGTFYDSMAKTQQIRNEIPSIKHIVLFDIYTHISSKIPKNCTAWLHILNDYPQKPVQFTPVLFNAPVFIMYSSGTTGKPKCIVHGVGGILVSVAIEGILHSDISPCDRVFFYSTCGWMMWNWLVGQLFARATLLLYDGSPIWPKTDILFDYMQAENATFMGISAKYIEVLQHKKCSVVNTHTLPKLRMMGSTGSVLSPELFVWIQDNIKPNIYISSLSGGTDIVGCFLMGNPLLPVYKGELVSPVLGKAVEVWDDKATPLQNGIGELVCVQPFPSMPLYFWNDTDNKKYRSAYFKKFPDIWCHGDFVEKTHTGYIIHGRSDTTLNPGGVRIGTAEIYNQLLYFDSIADSVVIGQKWQQDSRIVLFVVMQENQDLTEELITDIKTHIKTACTPRHVPAVIVAVPDIPRTRSGKISEVCVSDMVHNTPIKNLAAIGNPECLKYYKDIPELQQ